MAEANLKKHERLLGEEEHFKKQSHMAKDTESSLKKDKKSEKAGERAEGELKKARRRTQRANRYTL